MTSDPALVLVVDDNDAARFAKVQFVRRAGYRVIEASTAREAIAMTRLRCPDLVLLDVNLPDLSGLEVCRVLKAAGNDPAVQVLQLSSTAISDVDRVRGLEGGADAYLTEPISPDVVVATIEGLLRVRRAERALAEAARREREAREDAERANRSKDEFLATLSHELRTPLNSMVGWIWHLRHAPHDEAWRQRALDGLERSTALQSRLINDLFDVSRISRGKLDLELARVDLNQVLASAVEAAEPAALAKDIVLQVSSRQLFVLGDPARLHQVAVNLVTNAIQFSAAGGQVFVTLESDGDEAVLRVRDEGRGIEPEVLPYIFEPFRQGQHAHDRSHAGLGLGLAIVRQLVRMHRGNVVAESAGAGRGATFTVRIPCEPDNPAASAGPIPGGHELSGRAVLIVDDDEDSRVWVRALVESAGGAATAVSSMRAAVEALEAGAYDLLLSDIGMPGQDGIELVQTARHRGWTLPAVAVTAFASPADRGRILEAGYDAYVTKPIDPIAFVATLAALTGRAPA